MSYDAVVVSDNRTDGFLTVLLSAKCPFTKVRFQHKVRMTDSELGNLLQGRMVIQKAVPALTGDEREMCITGIYPGGLGEEEFAFSCPVCGQRQRRKIEECGKTTNCIKCGVASTPFEKE